MTHTTLPLSERHAAHLAASALSPDIIAERGYCSVASLDELTQADGHLAEYQRIVPALVVPIYRLGERYTTVIRPDTPRQPERKGKKRTIKYEWPAKRPLCLDVLPRFAADLKNILIPIWFTEGAKKADALATLNRGIVPISLNGVWAWCQKDGQGQRQLLPDFDELELRGRTVVLAFDSDYADKPEVRFALHDFARLLKKRGANVGILTLPNAADGAKQGVDDAIAAGWTFADLQLAIADYQPGEPDLLDAAQYWRYYYDERWAYDTAGQVWRRWTGTHWEAEPDKSTRLDAQAAQVMRELGIRITSGGKIDGVIRMAATQCERTFTPAAGLVNFSNGTLDTTTGALRPHDHADDLTYCLPYAYAPTAPWGAIAAFMAETIPDQADRDAYAAHLGLCLLRDTKMHKAMLLYGPPRSGKSTLLQLANLIAGNEPAANAGPELFDRETEGLRSRAVWNGRRLVTLEELPAEALRSEELVKAMTAHGGVAQRRLHRHEDMHNQWLPKLLMATNEPPRYSDRTGALTERLLYIRCPNHRPEGQRNIHLLDTLRGELSGFVAHCLALAVSVLQTGRYAESDAARALRAEVEMQGDPLKMFLHEECVMEAGEFISTDELYAAYRDYLEKGGHTRPMAKVHFARALQERYRQLTTERRYILQERKRCMVGLRLRTASDPEVDDNHGTDGTARDSNTAVSVPSISGHQEAVNGSCGTDGTVKQEQSKDSPVNDSQQYGKREITVPSVPLAHSGTRFAALGSTEPAWDSNAAVSVPCEPIVPAPVHALIRRREYEKARRACKGNPDALAEVERLIDAAEGRQAAAD
jgi:P4 family phage/plasmid primase-like protien